MSKPRLTLLAALLFSALSAHAEDGHDHGPGIQETLATKQAQQQVDRIAAENKVPADTVVAIVNGVKLTQGDYMRHLMARMKQSDSPELPERQMLLDEMTSRAVVVQDALANKLDQVPEFQEKINFLRDALLAEFAIQKQLKDNQPSDDSMRAIYDERIKELTPNLPKEYQARHILVKTEEEAKQVITDLGQGKDFAKMAETLSLDKGSAVKGGELGWFKPTDMVKPFADAVTALDKGARSSAPVQTDFGWHVLEIQDIRNVTPPSFDDVKERIRSELQSDTVVTYVQKLREAAKIELPEQPAVK